MKYLMCFGRELYDYYHHTTERRKFSL